MVLLGIGHAGLGVGSIKTKPTTTLNIKQDYNFNM